MRFDNRNFETNAATSINTLEKLNNSLALKGATRGLEDVDAAARRVDVSSIGTAVDKVGLRFNALYSMADQVFRNITNSAMATGKKLISTFAIEPLSTGFSEYELKMGSIQTIMAGTGESLETVNKHLNELNKYSDQTIYSFSDMTQNIGKFTNAGVKLDDAVSAIKGISNVAAVSGANTNEASRAMYNFSQALSAGYVKLIDWKSIENANMATVEFKNQLIDTAVELGVVTKTSDGMYKTATGKVFNATKNFNEVLQEQWMTSDVLITTLGKYADETTEIGKKATKAATEVKTFHQMMDTLKESAQSGWAQTWEIIFGDFNEGKELWTKLSTVFGGILESSAKARNELFENWKVMGGRTALVDSLENIIDGLGTIIKPIKEAFRDIFPPMTAEKLVAFTNGLKNLTEKLKINNDTADKLKRTFKGVFAAFDIVFTITKAVTKGIMAIVKAIFPASGGLLEFTATIGDSIVAFRDFLKAGDGLVNVFTTIGNGIGKVIAWLLNLTTAAASTVIDFAGIDIGGIDNLIDRIKKRFEPLGAVFSAIGKGIMWLYNKMKPIVVGMGRIFDKLLLGISGMFKNIFENASFSSIFDGINSVLSSGLLVVIIKFINSLTKCTKSVDGFKKKIFGILDEVKNTFGALQSALKADVLMKIAKAIAILAISLVVLSLVDSDKLTFALLSIGALFMMLMATMSQFTKMSDKFDKGKFGSLNRATSALVTMSIAVLLLASALAIIAKCDPVGIGLGLAAVTTLLGALVGVIWILSKNAEKTGTGMKKGLKGLIGMSLALLILAGAVKMLSTMDLPAMGKGLLAVAVLLASLTAFMKIAGDAKFGIGKGTGLILLATSLIILSKAVKTFASMDTKSLAKGILAVTALMSAVALFTRIMGNGSKLFASAVSLTIIASAMLIFSKSIADMGALSWGEIARGLTSMASALAAVTIALRLLPKSAILQAAGLVVAASALAILGKTMNALSSLSWDDVARGLTALGGSLAILAVGLLVMNKARMGLLALPIAAASLTVLAGALKLLGSLSWEEIGKGLLVIAGAFVILGVAGYALKSVVPTILALSAAVAIFGIACLAVGVGMLAFSAGLAGLAAAGAGAAKAIASIIITVVELIPMIFVKIGEGIILLAQVIAAGLPQIGNAIKAIVLTIISVLVECVPALAEGLFALIVKLLELLVDYAPTVVSLIGEFLIKVIDMLADYAPQLVDSIFNFIINILNGIATRIPDLVQAFVNIIMAVFQGVIDALSGVDPEVLKQGLIGVGILTGLVAALALIAPLIPGAILGAIGLGVVITELALIFAAIGAIAQLPGLTWLVNEGGDFMQAVGTAIGKFVGGIVGGIAQGVTSALPQIGTDLSGFMTNAKPFIDGAKSIDASAMEGAKALASIIITLTAANLLESITSWITGGSSMAEFAAQLVPFGEAMVQFSGIVAGNIDEGAVTAAANAGKIMADMAKTLPNSGGVVGFFAGENDLDTFAAKLVPFGMAITAFSGIVAGKIDEGAVTAAANAGKAMAEMAKTIPNSGGVVGFFAGNNDMDTFAAQLIPFGTAITQFSKTVAGKIDESAVTSAANAGLLMASLQQNIPGTKGVVQFFTGEKNLGTFSEGIVPFGKAMVSFSKEVSGKIDEGAVTAAANAGKALAEMNNALPKSGGLKGLFGGNKDMETFSSGIVSFGSAVKKYSKEVTGIDASALSKATNAVKDLVSMAKSMSGVDFESFGSFGKGLGKIGKDGVNKFIEAFKDSKDKVVKAGETMVKKLIEGVNNKSDSLNKKLTSMASDAAKKIKNSYDSFYKAGSYLVDGFADGISENDYKAKAKATAMAKAAAKAAEEALDINSPSKVFRRIGMSVPEGFALGIEKMGRNVEASSTSMTSVAVSTVQDAITKLASLVESDIDTQPTIRPVLDLSDIKSGAGAIGSMLDMGPSVGVTANVGAINAMMNRRSQNGGAEDVVSAIDKLNKNLGNIGNTSYNINGVTYDDGSNVAEAIKTIIQAAKVERRT